MAKSAANKKYLQINDIRAYYNKKSKQVELLTGDPDLTGEEFRIQLKQGTPTDLAIRSLMHDNAIITMDELTDMGPVISKEEVPLAEKTVVKRKARILAITGHNGTGKTSVAMALGTIIAQNYTKKVLLIDMDLRDGSIGFLLGQYAPTALNLFVDTNKNSEGMKKHLIYDKKLKFHVLLAPKRARTAEYLTADLYKDIIEKLQWEFDYIILDTNTNTSRPQQNTAIAMADQILHVTTLSIGSIYAMNRFFDEISSPLSEDGLAIEPKNDIKVVVNCYGADFGVNDSLLERAAAGAKILTPLPLDSEIIVAMNHNNLGSFVNEDNELAKKYQELAESIVSHTA